MSLVRLLDFFRIVRGIYLEDFEGEVYCTWVRNDPFNTKMVRIYPFMRLGRVSLNPDGTVRQPHYCKKWKYMHE